MVRTSETVLLYARFICALARRERLRPLDRDGVARIVEYASRLAGDGGQMSIEMRAIADVLREAVGLTGKQGVVIPAANTRHLMLRQDVVTAAAEGRFAIYPIDTVDQGIALLSGIPAGQPDAAGTYPPDTINRRVADRLDAFAAKAAELLRQAAAAEARP